MGEASPVLGEGVAMPDCAFTCIYVNMSLYTVCTIMVKCHKVFLSLHGHTGW